MIISHILGGLGNQMFQYAFGRALAVRHRTDLYVDLSEYDNGRGYALHNGFELEHIFSISAMVATEKDVEKLLGFWRTRYLRRMLLNRYGALLRGQCYVLEPHFHFSSSLHELPDNIYLRGYWQTQKYFHAIEHILRTEFSFKVSLTGLNANLAECIDTQNSVSIHIRRGDYVSNKQANKLFGTCTIDYYVLAIQYILERIETPHFYVFSDDIDWVRSNLKIASTCTFVDHNTGQTSFQDMHLMSLCRHHIIANSSFSWWGAWLNQATDKIVVAPREWFVNNKLDTRDLLPENWVRL